MLPYCFSSHLSVREACEASLKHCTPYCVSSHLSVSIACPPSTALLTVSPLTCLSVSPVPQALHSLLCLLSPVCQCRPSLKHCYLTVSPLTCLSEWPLSCPSSSCYCLLCTCFTQSQQLIKLKVLYHQARLYCFSSHFPEALAFPRYVSVYGNYNYDGALAPFQLRERQEVWRRPDPLLNTAIRALSSAHSYPGSVSSEV